MTKESTQPKIHVMTIFGTRPEAVKMAPLVNALRADARFRCTVCVTAQHRELLDRVLTLFSITPDYDLNIMRERQTLADITTRVLSGLCGVIAETRPALALVHGDTTTSFAAALAAFYNRVPVGHVEAGLRTNNIYFPYPEEMNRKLTGAIASMHFAPTEVNRQNLLREGVPDENIFVTGNTALDALKTTARGDYRFEREALNAVDFKKYRVLTVEAHRTENLGAPLQEILRALRHILEIYPDMYVVYSVHPNPAVKEPVRQALSGHPRVLLQEPFDLADYHNLIMRSFLALSDSGGIQEESPSLGTPVLVLRGETERPEAVKAGIVRLVGTSFDRVVEGVRALADDADAYRAMKGAANPYGDG
ncbi:MAG: UDP-N-acetylglucosamine 2-epimerase (non-hydrolyzing), partial [Clostridiales bacterium]|nr:UDP-N-acetylglucosamine 2-epimerase (non-hydrolyzing) [Clostridiales bacterium]